jgi:hypothetical protein
MINGKIHYKWSFSIAMLNYQRVSSPTIDNIVRWLVEVQKFQLHQSNILTWRKIGDIKKKNDIFKIRMGQQQITIMPY